MKKIKIVFLLVIGLAFLKPATVSAQFFLGGDMNVTFLHGTTIDIAPIAGYKYKRLSIGISPVLMYTAAGDVKGGFSVGGRVFAEMLMYKGLFAHAEFEVMNTGYINSSGFKMYNWVMGAPIGIGYEQKIAEHVLFKGMVLYDALLDIDLNQSSSKANPSVRGGIVYTF
jgi:hypothetical protein